jgi:hypothetical protein
MRESCKISGASKARGSGAGEAAAEEIPTGIGGAGETTELTSGARVAVTEGKA